MNITDAIVVGEGWISEHYFTTDARSQSFQAKVLERRKTWDTEAAEGRPTVRSRFVEARQRLEVDLGSLGEHGDPVSAREAADDVDNRLVTVLGLDAHGLRLDRQGRVLRVSAPGITGGAPLAVVFAAPVATVEELLAKYGSTLPEPVVLDDDVQYTSAARLVSALFVEDAPPDLVLVLAGRWAMLAERERWAEGRYLAVDLQLVCERNDTKKGGEIDRVLACLGSESIAPDADGDLWWHAVLEESIKHTVGVSQDLRDGVRLSIEIIANEVVKRRREKGLDPLPAEQAQVLAKQSLRFLYRILFLLFAEASPELGVLPVGAPEYAQGYSLDRLRELVQVELATPQARSGTHLYDSLGVLFRLVDRGHKPKAASAAAGAESEDGSAFDEGLTFNSLRADLFKPKATAHIDTVGLGNAALQEVLTHLLLSKESHGRDRGFISYAELGINQLGAVYEGLMSYTGFFAETDLYEVAKGGDSSKGSWVVPVDRAQGISRDDFVRFTDKVTGEEKPVLHERGTFVFRLAGRERQQSASYYTPEVLTRFTVGQALEELLDQDGTTTTAAEILDLTVCEPALGSGAFAIEAVRQLAEQYLQRRQRELGERIDPDEYPRRLQEVKAYLALHNVYGVDLNATAVELAEISLWLDTMVEGLDAPWFGLHLRRGNSLIGARRAVFRRDQVTSKRYLKDVPRNVPLTALADDVRTGGLATGVDGGIHHFLLPAPGWGSVVDAKEAKALAPEALARLKYWRSSVQAKPSKSQVDALEDLSYRVEALWQIALQRLEIAEREARRAIPVWGADGFPSGGAVQREQIEAALADAKGAYQRLRRVMDAWCALWFWPLTDTLMARTADGQAERIQPPSLTQWIDALQMLLGRHAGKARTSSGGNQTLGAGMGWDELGDYESVDLGFASARPVESVLDKHPWLRVCEAVAGQQGFFHWELDFAVVLAHGGFKLQVGNPPWVRPNLGFEDVLAEGDPRWRVSDGSMGIEASETLSLPGMRDFAIESFVANSGLRAHLQSVQIYPELQGVQADLYRNFMVATWRLAHPRGISALIHYETHFTEDGADGFRSLVYARLRRHWGFINQLKLFEEIGNTRAYGVCVYGSAREVDFLHAAWLFHPETVIGSLRHNGLGPEPGIKNDVGEWARTAHASRVIRVRRPVIRSWGVFLRRSRLDTSPMLSTVNTSSQQAIDTLAKAGRLSDLNPTYDSDLQETTSKNAGVISKRWGTPKSRSEVILQGSQLGVANPLFQEPGMRMLSHRDFVEVDLEAIPSRYVPVTAFKFARSGSGKPDPQWNAGNPRIAPVFRVAWRNMADNVGVFRTLQAAIIPPEFRHIHSVTSLGLPTRPASETAVVAAVLASLIADFAVRIAPRSTISGDTIDRLPMISAPQISDWLALRVLRLNCLTDAYAEFWSDCWVDGFLHDEWTPGAPAPSRPLSVGLSNSWSEAVPLRLSIERRQALLEIDALVALGLSVTADELCAIYRSHFPVLYGYDRNTYYYDANGRLVPNTVLAVLRKKGDRITAEERTATHPGSGIIYAYELPFVTLDREADMRRAYAHFAQILRDRA